MLNRYSKKIHVKKELVRVIETQQYIHIIYLYVVLGIALGIHVALLYMYLRYVNIISLGCLVGFIAFV